MFGVSYDAAGIRTVEKALAHHGLRAKPGLTVDTPKRQTVVLIVADSDVGAAAASTVRAPVGAHAAVAREIRIEADYRGAFSQRRASQLVELFGVSYDAAGIRTVEEALAYLGLAANPRLAVDTPKRQTVVTIVGIVNDDEYARSENTFCGIELKDDRIESLRGGGPLVGARATVDAAGQLTARITATRLVLTGPLALALRKKVDQRELYLMVEGAGWAISVAVNPEQGAEARAFAAKINAAATAAEMASGGDRERPLADIPDQIRKLGELRDAGLLTDDEFSAKKAELLARL
jgi:hypothetical protein